MSQSYDVFVSYARDDLERVQPWVQELKDGGVSTFFDKESLLGGGKWQGEIVEAIHSAKLVILFVSRSSVASEFVPKELALAVEMKKHILPVFLEETEVRGQLAFCIAGLQRVQAQGPQVNVRQILRTIQPKLREFGVEWVNPTQFLNGVRQASRRDADELAGTGNVRRPKEPEPEAARPKSASVSIVPDKNRVSSSTPIDEDVRFTVYRPQQMVPGQWATWLAFAYRDPDDQASASSEEEVQSIAKAMLGHAMDNYRSEKQSSSAPLPRESTITIVPQVNGLRFSPESRSFDWNEAVHHEQFVAVAGAESLESVLRGRVTFFVGALILAEINVRVHVTQSVSPACAQEANVRDYAKPYRNIFASYSHKDRDIVEHFERLVTVYGDRYLRDVHDLRSGEDWTAGLESMIAQADVFQVFWSTNSMRSRYVRREWEYALSLNRPHFVRPTYWESPFPEDKEHGLPPASLRSLHFQMLPIQAVPSFISSNTLRQDTPSVGAAPISEPAESVPPATTGRWLCTWFVLMVVTLGIGQFFWVDAPSWGTSSATVPPKNETSIPTALPVRLEDEAPDLAKQYYLAANLDPAGQVALLADTVDYLGNPGWKHSNVKADLEAYAKRWLRQHFEVLAKPPQVRVIEPDKVVECDVPLRYTSENAIVTSTATFTGRLRMQRFGNEAKVTSVAEVPGTRKSEPLKFNPEAQKKAVIDFITRSVVSGSSTSGMKPEDIAAMYVEKPDYFGRIATHEDIIKETQTLISRWELRDYRVLEEPDIISGVGTPDVEVKVGLDYRVSSPSRGGKTSQGWVRSVYVVHFSADGTPLIQKHAELDRGQ